MALPSFLTTGLVAGAVENIAVVKSALDELKTILTNGVDVANVKDGAFLVTPHAVTDLRSKQAIHVEGSTLAAGSARNINIAHGVGTIPAWAFGVAYIDLGSFGGARPEGQVTVIGMDSTNLVVRFENQSDVAVTPRVIWEVRY